MGDGDSKQWFALHPKSLFSLKESPRCEAWEEWGPDTALSPTLQKQQKPRFSSLPRGWPGARPVTRLSLAIAPVQSFESSGNVPDTVVGWNKSPKDIYVLIPGICDCYFILQKRTLQVSLNSGFLNLSYLGGPQCNPCILMRGRFHTHRRGSNVTMEAETAVMGPQAKECWRSTEFGRDKEGILL